MNFLVAVAGLELTTFRLLAQTLLSKGVKRGLVRGVCGCLLTFLDVL